MNFEYENGICKWWVVCVLSGMKGCVFLFYDFFIIGMRIGFLVIFIFDMVSFRGIKGVFGL